MWLHESTISPVETGVYCFILASLTIEVNLKLSIPRLMKRRKQTLFDEWMYLLFTDESYKVAPQALMFDTIRDWGDDGQ